jgi:hypothetical protein
MSSLVIDASTGTASSRAATPAEQTLRDIEEAAWLADTPRRNAQAVLDKHAAEGYTRAWESAVAPQVAAETLPEYDQTIYDERIAARAVVEG